MGIASIAIGTFALLPMMLFLLPWRQVLGDDALFPLAFMIFEGLSLIALPIATVGLILGIADIFFKRAKQKPKTSAIIGTSINLGILLLFATRILISIT